MNEKNNIIFMDQALHQATRALKKNEVPVGAIIVGPDGAILSKAFNKVETAQTQLAHAETLAIQKACKKVENWRLNGCWIYVTLEPCLMCFGLIQLSRLEGIVFGATSSLFGVGLSNVEKLPPYSKNLKIIGGIREEESLDMLKKFFDGARKKRKVTSETKSKVT